MTTITERVAAGAAYLDERDPEWWRADVERAINLRTLDLHEPHLCVLGQRCPLEIVTAWAAAEDEAVEPFHAQAQQLHGHNNWSKLWQWSIDFGFNLEFGYDEEWAELTAEWRRVITERRAST